MNAATWMNPKGMLTSYKKVQKKTIVPWFMDEVPKIAKLIETEDILEVFRLWGRGNMGLSNALLHA